MFDLFQKTFLAGLGASLVTSEKILAGLSHLVQRGVMTTEEAQKVADNILADSRKEYDSFRHEMETAFEQYMQKANLITRTQFDQALKRIEALEQRIADTKDQDPGFK